MNGCRNSVSTSVLLALTALCFSAAAQQRDADVQLRIDSEYPGAQIPDDFAGLSFETENLLPSSAGSYYFDDSNSSLIETFHNLGIKSLRIGGNTADVPTLPFPSIRDADHLFSFAQAVSSKVIFTFRLRAGGPQDVAPLAKHLMDHDRSLVECFEIGNEPDIYEKSFDAYRSELNSYIKAFDDFGVDRKAKFCGPGTTPSKVEWAREFVQDFGHSTRIRFVTQHAYPGASGRNVTDAAAGRSAMLSTAWVNSYDSFFQSFAHNAETSRLPYRVEETNSYYNGGAKDVSDTFASTLWGLDYMHWWASHGAAGINFHTGERVAAADESTTCYYAVFLSSGSKYAIQPLGYAMKAFELGGHGRVVPVHLTAPAPPVDVTAYAVLAPDKTLYVTVINKEHGPNAQNAAVTVLTRLAYGRSEVMRMENSTADLSAKIGITLGGMPIGDNGVWDGHWQPLSSISTGNLKLNVPRGSAAILKFAPNAPAVQMGTRTEVRPSHP